MKALKIKSFKCYQPVKLGQDYVTSFVACDESKVCTRDNHPFYIPDMQLVVIKHKEDSSELCIPMTNIQGLVLEDELLKKAKPHSHDEHKEPSEPAAAPTAEKNSLESAIDQAEESLDQAEDKLKKVKAEAKKAKKAAEKKPAAKKAKVKTVEAKA